MKIGSDWRNRLWACAMVTLAATGTLIWWWRDRPMPLDHLADVAAIVEKFEKTVFGNELGKNDSTHLVLWPGKLNIFLATALPNDLYAALGSHTRSLEYLTGLEIAVVNTRAPTNIELYIASKTQYSQIAADFVSKKKYDSNWTSKTACYAIGSIKKWRYW